VRAGRRPSSLDRGDGIDDELREVFLDEAGELLPEIERHRLRWRADNQQREALGEVRRALHTLKGSGRMVHAEAVAELAWGAEHLLNRVLEGRSVLSPEGWWRCSRCSSTCLTCWPTLPPASCRN
jgi:chemosensory pili system protein ChpA (sensor histidine kinase/response regulator)